MKDKKVLQKVALHLTRANLELMDCKGEKEQELRDKIKELTREVIFREFELEKEEKGAYKSES